MLLYLVQTFQGTGKTRNREMRNGGNDEYERICMSGCFLMELKFLVTQSSKISEVFSGVKRK